jgi:hypothetical protein
MMVTDEVNHEVFDLATTIAFDFAAPLRPHSRKNSLRSSDILGCALLCFSGEPPRSL